MLAPNALTDGLRVRGFTSLHVRHPVRAPRAHPLRVCGVFRLAEPRIDPLEISPADQHANTFELRRRRAADPPLECRQRRQRARQDVESPRSVNLRLGTARDQQPAAIALLQFERMTVLLQVPTLGIEAMNDGGAGVWA